MSAKDKNAQDKHAKDAVAMLTAQHREVSGMFKQFEDMGDNAKAGKQELAARICEALILHTAIEEEIFYPAVREAAKEGDDMIDEATVEHASAKELIQQLLDMDPDDDLFDAKVKVLGEQIDHHVEEEEEEMFPQAKKAKLDLVALGQQMAQRQQQLQASASA